MFFPIIGNVCGNLVIRIAMIAMAPGDHSDAWLLVIRTPPEPSGSRACDGFRAAGRSVDKEEEDFTLPGGSRDR